MSVPVKNQRIHIMTGGSCNNNCIFCCDRDPHIKLALRNRLRYGTIHLSLPGFFKESGIPANMDSILFTGAEPTLNPDLPVFIQYARDKGFKNIAVQTNGRRLRYKEYCARLCASGLTELNISLHGSNRKIHDALTRTPGSFEQTRRGLHNIVALKKKYRFSLNVNFTVTKSNYKNMHEYVGFIKSFNTVDAVVFNTLMFTGNAARFFNQLFISYRQIADETLRIVSCASFGKKPSIQVTPLPVCVGRNIHRYRGIYEEVVQLRKDIPHRSRRGGTRLKHRRCRPCVYYGECDGVDKMYAEKTGWDEFSVIRKK